MQCERSAPPDSAEDDGRLPSLPCTAAPTLTRLPVPPPPPPNPPPQVVLEVYDEVVLWQPTEALYNRCAAHAPRAAPPSQLAQFFVPCAPDAEYQCIQRARQRLAQIRANVENTAAQLEAAEAAGAAGWAGA